MPGFLEQHLMHWNLKNLGVLTRLPPDVLRFGLPALMVALMTLVRVALWPILGDDMEYLLFWPAVMAAAWYGGFWPGVWATTLSAVATIGLFYLPLASMGLGHAFGLLLFLTIGVGISLLFEKAGENQRAWRANVYHRSLIEASLDPLVTIDPRGKITDANAAAEQATGRTRQELIGHDFCDYFTKPDRARAVYEAVFHTGFVRDFALEIRHRDGHATPVLFNATVYRDEGGSVIGVFAAARDISERKQAEELLRASESRFRTIFEEAPLGIAVIDSQSAQFHEVNPRFAEIAGRSRKEMAEIDWKSITYLEDVQEELDNMAALNAGRIAGLRCGNATSGPTARWCGSR